MNAIDSYTLTSHVRVMFTKCLYDNKYNQGPLLLTWFNFSPSMDK